MIGHFQLGQNSIEQFEFARRTVQIRPGQSTSVQSFVSNMPMDLPHADTAAVVEMPADLLFQLVKDERMVAYLPQLHDGVHQRFRIGSLAVLKTRQMRRVRRDITPLTGSSVMSIPLVCI